MDMYGHVHVNDQHCQFKHMDMYRLMIDIVNLNIWTCTG